MEQRSWFVHVEFVVLLIVLLGGFYTLDSKIDRQSARTDQLYVQFQTALAEQTQRTDRLYEMFIDLVKEKGS